MTKAGKVIFFLELGLQPLTGHRKSLEGNIRPQHHILVAADAIHILVSKAAFEHGAGFINDPIPVAVPKAFIDPPQSIEVKAAGAHRPFRAAEPIQRLIVGDAVVAHS